MTTLSFDQFLKQAGGTPKDITISSINQQVQDLNKSDSIDLLNPAKQALSGLKTLYGGSNMGIANKLKSDVQAGAYDIQQGNVIKGVVKSGLRTAGDVAGAVYAPIGAAVQSTGINNVFDKIGELSQKGGDLNPINMITNIPAVQDFVIKHPNIQEDFSRVMNIVLGSLDKGTINPESAIPRTGEQINTGLNTINTIPENINNLRPTAEQIQLERQNKMQSGLNEQNVRLKTADKSFSDNIITRKNPAGEIIKITPIDTFTKYNVAPVIENGSIKMGNWQEGVGELGKLKSQVELLDNKIDTTLKNTGQKIPLETLKQQAIDSTMKNSDFKQSGTVTQNVSKIENRFADYQKSYGDNIDIAELNNIRKTANKDYSPDTQDTSLIIGDVARDFVYKSTPDKIVKSLLQQQGELLAAKKYAERINGTKVTGGRLGNIALRATGAVVGSTIKGLPVIGPILGAIGGEFTARALQQSQFKSAWTELRSLIQRSNKTEQSQSANNIPSKVNISK